MSSAKSFFLFHPSTFGSLLPLLSGIFSFCGFLQSQYSQITCHFSGSPAFAFSPFFSGFLMYHLTTYLPNLFFPFLLLFVLAGRTNAPGSALLLTIQEIYPPV
ncbi:hypothetical protein Cpha266_2530 [Chlorobium phaeobacteroides DSM 266]|uniref:Uncharacterized protein n=1 Tax=Chlorobium phaeobacteroides (strain DSM 266 / SMG 266 / 2430) TaxID=290317 RepID=A1BJE1_CHLPD|nr:hypothetical protein Cpha266_2530 [Chlorobium phaeobacteroides DSM 266]